MITAIDHDAVRHWCTLIFSPTVCTIVIDEYFVAELCSVYEVDRQLFDRLRLDLRLQTGITIESCIHDYIYTPTFEKYLFDKT